jgi:chemotaxis signal transduction protein
MAGEGKWLVCRVGETLYGLDLGRVQEIVYRPRLTGLPTFRPPVAGMMEWLGRQVAVLDLQGGGAEGPAGRPVVVVDAGGGRIGLVVDQAGEIITRQAGQGLELDPLLAESLAGVERAFEYGQEMIFVLDAARLAELVS